MILIHGTQSALSILCFASLHPTVKPAAMGDVVLAYLKSSNPRARPST
jgi:hypothetical protein